jgi:hypothetical protein
MSGRSGASRDHPFPGSSRPSWAPPGDQPARLRGTSLVAGFAVLLGICLLVAALLAVIAKAPEPPPDCQPGTECGGPPGGGVEASPAPPGSPVVVPPGTIGIRAGTPWISPDLGYQFEYSDWWELDTSTTDAGETDLDYQGSSGDGLLIVTAVPAGQAAPDAFADQWLAKLKQWAPDLRVDGAEKNMILGPEIGFVDGIGRTYAGSWSSPQSATAPVGVGLVAASDGRLTAAVVVIVWNPDRTVGEKWLQYNIRSHAELSLKTFRWGTSP